MELDECIAKRRSVRKFSTKEIPKDMLAKIIKAGTEAPTAGNLQDWRFIVISDDAQKKKVAAACEEQEWVADAGIIIVVCTDIRDIERFYGSHGKEVYSIQDASAAAENMVLKATDLGLGSCWIGAFDDARMKEILTLPGFVNPQVVLVFGYSTEKLMEKSHFNVEDVVHFNQYGKRAIEYPEMGEIIKRLVEKGKKAIKH